MLSALTAAEIRASISSPAASAAPLFAAFPGEKTGERAVLYPPAVKKRTNPRKAQNSLVGW